VTFKRSRTQLSGIARPMYFAVSVDPVRNLTKFEQGWHEMESDAEESWRWMEGRRRLSFCRCKGAASSLYFSKFL